MKVEFSFSFEFMNAPPETTKGVVEATTMPTCFARAARLAMQAHPGRRWSSCVCVLLERLDEADDDSAKEMTDPHTCTGCGTSKALCLEYRLNGQACCPDCRHVAEGVGDAELPEA